MSENKKDFRETKQEVKMSENGAQAAWLGGILVLLTTFFSGFCIGKSGKNKAVDDAYRKGYSDASAIFDEKFRLQHEAFMSKEKRWEEHEGEYRKLLNAYEDYIFELKSQVKCDETEFQIIYFQEKRDELKSLEKNS